MQTSAFRLWLKTGYLQINGNPLADGTQVSRGANCSTIEQLEGDLDAHYDRDGMTELLHRLSYSRADKRAGLEPQHRIPINGDIVNGTVTYRSAANLYRKFRVAQSSGFWEACKGEALGVSTPTERQMMSKIRLGQNRFRYLILERWDYRCAITNAILLLTASHIKPWRLSSDKERLDSFNGVCLSPVFDKAFDTGLLTIRFDGRLILSPHVPKAEAQKLGIMHGMRMNGLRNDHRPYLEFHQQNIWQHAGASIDEAYRLWSD